MLTASDWTASTDLVRTHAKAEAGQQGDRVTCITDGESNHGNCSFLSTYSKDLILTSDLQKTLVTTQAKAEAGQQGNRVAGIA